MLTVNQPLNHLVYTRSTTQQSTHPLRPPVYGDGELDIWYPWSETGGSLSTQAIFTVAGARCSTFMSSNLCYWQYILPTHKIYCKPLTSDVANILWKRPVGSQWWSLHPHGCYYHCSHHWMHDWAWWRGTMVRRLIIYHLGVAPFSILQALEILIFSYLLFVF